MNEELLKKIYEKYGLSSKGPYEKFVQDMQNPEVQRKVYDKYGLSQKGPFEKFQLDLGYQEQQQAEASAPVEGGLLAPFKQMIESAQTPAGPQDVKPVDPLVNAWKRGDALSSTADILNPDAAAPTEDQLGQVAELQQQTQSLPSSAAYQKFNEASSLGESLSALAESPVLIIGEIFAESTAGMVGNWEDVALRGAQGGATGAAYGAASTAMAGPLVVPGTAAGMTAGASAGVVTGMAETSLKLEWAGKFLEVLQEAGVDTSNKEALAKAFADDNLISRARELAGKKSIPIALFDLISGGIAGKIVTKPAKSLIGKVGQGALELGVQGGLGSAGEAAGQVSAGEELNASGIIAEFIGEGATAPVEIVAGAAAYNQNRSQDPAIAEAEQDIDTSGDPVLDKKIDNTYDDIASKLDELEENVISQEEIDKLAEDLKSDIEAWSAVDEENELRDQEYTPEEAGQIQAQAPLPSQPEQEQFLAQDDSEATPEIDKITEFENAESERMEFESFYSAEELAQMSEEAEFMKDKERRKGKKAFEAREAKKAAEPAPEPKEAPKEWFWVTGSEKQGFRVVNKKPRTREVSEPFESREAAERSIANYFLTKPEEKTPLEKRAEKEAAMKAEDEAALPTEKKVRTKPQIDPEERKKDLIVKYTAQLENIKTDKPGKQRKRLEILNEKTLDIPEVNALVRKQQENLNKLYDEKEFAKTLRERTPEERLDMIQERVKDKKVPIDKIKVKLAEKPATDGPTAIKQLNEINELFDQVKSSGKLLSVEKSEITRMVKERAKVLEPIAETEIAEQKAVEAAKKAEGRTKQLDKDSHLTAIAKATLLGNPVGIKKATEEYLAWRKEQGLPMTKKGLRGATEPIDEAYVQKQASTEFYTIRADKELKYEAERAASEARRKKGDKKAAEKRIKSQEEQRRLDQLKDELGLSDEADFEPMKRRVLEGETFNKSNEEVINKMTALETITPASLFDLISTSVEGDKKFLSGLKALYLAADSLLKRSTRGKGIEIYMGNIAPEILHNGQKAFINGYFIQDPRNKRSLIILNKQTKGVEQGATAAHELIHGVVMGIIQGMRYVAKAEGIKSSTQEAFGYFISRIADLLDNLKTSVLDTYISIGRKLENDDLGALTRREQAFLALVSAKYADAHNVDVYSPEGIGVLIDDVLNNGGLHYFLFDPNELVAEAMSSPHVAGILSILENPQASVKGVKMSFFRQILEAFKDWLAKYGIRPVRNNYLESLGNYMEQMEKYYLREVPEAKDLDRIDIPLEADAPLIREAHATVRANMGNPSYKGIKKLINYIANAWWKDESIQSEEAVQRAVDEVNQRAKKNKLSPDDVKVIWRKIQKYRQELADAKALQRHAITYAKAHITRYEVSRLFRRDLDDFTSVNMDELTRPQIKILQNGIMALITAATPEQKAYNLVNKAKAVERLNKLLTQKGKYSKNPGLYLPVKVSISHFTNPATFSSILARYNTKAAQELFNTIFSGLVAARTHSLQESKVFLDGVFDVSNQYKLDHADHVKVGMYGAIFSTHLHSTHPEYWTEIEFNVAQVVSNAHNKLQAYEAELYRSVPKSFIEQEIKVAEELREKILRLRSMDGILNEGQQALYQEMRDFSAFYEEDMIRNTEGTWGVNFTRQTNYFPTYPLGRADDGEIGESDQLIPDASASNLWAALHNNKNYGKITARQTGFAKKKVQPKGYFYDYNAVSIATKFAPSILQDLYMTREAKILNHLLNGSNGNPIRNKAGQTITGSNGVLSAAAKKGLNRQIKSILGGAVLYDNELSRALKWLTNAKNNVAMAMLGTTGQLLVQMSSAPAASMIMNPKGVAKAWKLIMSIERGEDGHTNLQRALKKMSDAGASITIRDILFERWQTVADIQKEGLTRNAATTRAWAERVNSAALRGGDKMAARLVWFSEFFANGGDINNPSKEAVMAAERITGVMQNMSDVAMSAPFFRTNHAAARILLQMLYAFKTFALNAAFNVLYGTKYGLTTGNREARQVALANYTIALSYHAVQIYLIRPGYNTLSNAITGMDDDYDEEKNYEKHEELAWATWWDLLIGQWAPDLVQGMAKLQLHDALNRRAESRGEKFNPYTDSPLFLPRNAKDVLAEGSGIFGDVVAGGADMTSLILESMNALATGEEMDSQELGLRAAKDAFTFLPHIPFRGDLNKLLRNYEKKVKAEARAMKAAGGGQYMPEGFEIEEVGTEFELPEYEINLPQDPTELPEIE